MARRIFFSLFFLCFSFLFAENYAPCFSVCCDSPSPAAQRIYCDDDSYIYLGPQVAHLDLSNKSADLPGFVGADPDLDLDGVLGGIIGNYEYRKFRSLYVGIYSSWIAARVTNGGNPSRYIHDVEAEGRFGYNYMALQGYRLTVTPYLGFGFNWIYQKRSSSNTTPEILFEYYNYYLPVGLILDYLVYTWLHVGFHFKWMAQLDPTLKIDLLDGARFVLRKEQTSFFAELPFSFRFGNDRSIDLTFSPYWKRKRNGETRARTTSGTVLGIPKQSMTYWGGYVSLGYHF